MPRRILIAPDKFKGTLAAGEVARAIARGWASIRPGDQLSLLPITDGGDGFGPVLGELLAAEPQITETMDAAHRPCQSKWWWEPKTSTAIIESARTIGLAMLPSGKYHPFELDTLGLGAVFQAARNKGAKRILIGIGGSATNDGGFGLARAQGWRFVDVRDRLIERWTELHKLAVVYPPEPAVLNNVTLAVDVQNPLLGPLGATRIYGPQKGLQPEDMEMAESCLARLAAVMNEQFKVDFSVFPGAGAAGGLGFGLLAFLDACAGPGFELFAEHTGLDTTLQNIDLVVTGEGAIDFSTLMGKGVGQLALRCGQRKIPCIGMGGLAIRSDETSELFHSIYALTDLTDVADARSRPAYWLEQLAARAAACW